MKRRAFISMIVGAAGGLALPKWRIPDPVIILPPASGLFGYDRVSIALGYKVTAEEVADNLYNADNYYKILLPGLKKAWQDHYNDPEFEDLFK